MRIFVQLLSAISFFAVTYALDCTFPSAAAQCADFTVTCLGDDNSQLSLLLLPVSSSSPLIVPIPDPASSQDSFSQPIPFPSGTSFIAVLENGRARDSSLVSQVYTVSSSSDTSCITPLQPSNNTFTLTPATQCKIQTISWNMPDPVLNAEGGEFLNNLNITSFIPQGQTFSLDSVDNLGAANQAIWQVNVPAGLQYLSLFEYTGSDGNPVRMTSELQTVQPGDNRCITPNSPTVTVAAAPSLTALSIADLPTGVQTVSLSALPTVSLTTTTNSESDNGKKLALIAGSILGGVAIVASIVGLLLWYIRRKRQSTSDTSSMEEGSIAPLTIDPVAPMGLALPSSAAQSRSGTPSSARDVLAELPKRPFTLGRLRSTNARKITPSLMSWGNRGPLPASVRGSIYSN